MPVFLSLPGSGRGRVKLLNPLGVSVIMIQANKYKGKGIMRKLLIYLNEYRKECILAPLFKLLEASFELIVPLVVAAIIDHGIAASNKSYIFKMGGVMVLLALIGLACSITAQYFAAKAAEIAPTAICVFAPPKRQGAKPKPKNMLPRITLPQLILPGHNYDLIQ